jgi:hypothetical protein
LQLYFRYFKTHGPVPMKNHWVRGVIVDQPPHTKEMDQYNSRRKIIETGI